MNIVSIGKNYLLWHYSVALSDFFHIWWNYLWFVNHLFSVPDVIGSLFSPFKRLHEERGSILLHPEEFFSGLVVNIIMRLVGFFLRSAIIIMALLSFITVIIGGIIFTLLWLILPVLVVSFFLNGIGLLFS